MTMTNYKWMFPPTSVATSRWCLRREKGEVLRKASKSKKPWNKMPWVNLVANRVDNMENKFAYVFVRFS